MKTSSPYPGGMPIKMVPETVTANNAKNSGKASARYPSGTPTTSQSSSAAGKGGKRALTPGTSPTGS